INAAYLEPVSASISGVRGAQFGTSTTMLFIRQSVSSKDGFDLFKVQCYEFPRPYCTVVHIETVMAAPRLTKMELIVRNLVTSQPLDENGCRVAHYLSDIPAVRAHISARVQNYPIALLLQAAKSLRHIR